MLFQIFHDVRINYTLCFIGKSIFYSYYFRIFSFPPAKILLFLYIHNIFHFFFSKICISQIKAVPLRYRIVS